MRLLFVSLLILNLFFSAWSLHELLSGSGNLQHGVWIVICLATAVICILELRYQKMTGALGRPTLGSLEKFLVESSPEEAGPRTPVQKEELQHQDEPSEDVRRTTQREPSFH